MLSNYCFLYETSLHRTASIIESLNIQVVYFESIFVTGYFFDDFILHFVFSFNWTHSKRFQRLWTNCPSMVWDFSFLRRLWTRASSKDSRFSKAHGEIIRLQTSSQLSRQRINHKLWREMVYSSKTHPTDISFEHSWKVHWNICCKLSKFARETSKPGWDKYYDVHKWLRSGHSQWYVGTKWKTFWKEFHLTLSCGTCFQSQYWAFLSVVIRRKWKILHSDSKFNENVVCMFITYSLH